MDIEFENEGVAAVNMTNFSVNFEYPWLLLLLIPMIAVTLFLYFRVSKKYRRTRNRITSMVLHIIVSVLSVAVLSGMTFSYEEINKDNEVILLVDMSFSGTETEDDKNDFVKAAIEECKENFDLGVVTFGYDQVCAVPLGSDIGDAYTEYLNAPLPDNSATDIASALLYARDLIGNPKTAKIVLISDGAETDGEAMTVIRAIAADGISVNTVYFPDNFDKDEVRLIDATLPDFNPSVEEQFAVSVTLQSSRGGKADIILKDNGARVSGVTGVDLNADGSIKQVELNCVLKTGGLHVLEFSVVADNSAGDAVAMNNTLYSYINVENFNKVLIVERDGGESAALAKIMKEEEDFDVSVVGIASESLPKTVDELRFYDQVILMNIANADMPEGFIDILNSYVKDFGGGMFTVGGNKTDKYGNEVANMYDRLDMRGTLYQEMLPVQAIDYTPPVAVMIIIDVSGSMNDSSSESGQTRIEAAKDGAKSAIRALSSRDYCAVMRLTNDFSLEMPLVPVTQYESVFEVIDGLTASGGTSYTPSIQRAGLVLAGARNVERRHIVLVSDGYPGDSYEEYSKAIRDNYNNNPDARITFSMIAIGVHENDSMATDLRRAAEEDGHGRFYPVMNTDKLIDTMREELNVDAIKAVNHEEFVPVIKDHTKVVNGIAQDTIPVLGGFYGTRVKDDDSVEVPLNGKYVPIYAQWKYGEGRVGSFMCDLGESSWSAQFMHDSVGEQLIKNMIRALMPSTDIHPTDIDVGFEEDNYTTYVSVYTDLEPDESVTVTIKEINADGSDGDERVLTPTKEQGYSRIPIVIKKPGVHQITVAKLVKDGDPVTYTAYRAFSYSREYDMFADSKVSETLMTELASESGGAVIPTNAAWSIFDEKIEHTKFVIDPTLALIIIVIVLFLLDIAVRKFKFKWLHEILRDRKNGNNNAA